MRPVALLLGFLLLAGCGSEKPMTFPEDVSIEVGKPFPGLILPTLEDGSPSAVARFRGKKTLLHIFASW